MKNRNNTTSKRWRASAYGVAFLLIMMAGCDSMTDAEHTDDLQPQIGQSEMTTLGNAQNRVDVCHVNGKGEYNKITVADAAFETHIAHGDGAVGDPVPGMDGYIFNENCQPEEVVSVAECPCYSTTYLATLDNLQFWKEYYHEDWAMAVTGVHPEFKFVIADLEFWDGVYECRLFDGLNPGWISITSAEGESCRDILLEYEDLGS